MDECDRILDQLVNWNIAHRHEELWKFSHQDVVKVQSAFKPRTVKRFQLGDVKTWKQWLDVFVSAGAILMVG